VPVSGVVEVSGLAVAYGPVKAVNGISFCIGRGEIFGLLGRNGAGKTSTLSAIEGLLTRCRVPCSSTGSPGSPG